MSKISEQKALEEYPLPIEESDIDSFINQETFNSAKRTGYVKGYDKAIQDVLEKAEAVLTERMYFSDEEAKQFKEYVQKYMQDEM